MVKKDKTKPFRTISSGDTTDPESPTNPTDSTGPTAEDMLMNCAVSKLKADRTPIPDNRFILPPEYGVDGSGSSDAFNGYEYVDLGLPSGTKWAKMNVGAQTETDYGLYFAWGETQGYTASQVGNGEGQKAFSWNDYKFNPSGDESTFTKYNSTDGKTVLDLEDDAASVNWGGDWHMPNRAQCIELFKETKNGFVTNKGSFTQYAWSDNDHPSPTRITATISGWNTAGYFFFKSDVSDMDAAITSGDYLFVPAAGSCEVGEVLDVGFFGGVRASALGSEHVEDAWGFGFGSDGAGVGINNRFSGQSVRGVVGQMTEITDETTPGGGR